MHLVSFPAFRPYYEIAEDIDIVKALVENGANLKAKSNNGWTLLHFAAANWSFDVVQFLVEEKYFGKNSYISLQRHLIFFQLIPGISIQSVNAEVKLILDVNEVDNDGLSALHVATALEIVKYLIEKGGQDISKGLHAAASAGSLDTLQYLFENNTNIETRNKSGQTPLICAAINDQLEVVTHLVENKADVEARDLQTRTALDWAKYNNHVSVIAYLADKRK